MTSRSGSRTWRRRPRAQSVFFDNVRISAYHSYHVLDGMIGIPLANFVRLVNRNPGLLASFQDEADAYQAFLETNVIAKWQDSAAFYGDTWVNVSATEGYYREPTNFDTFATTTALDPLPYNQYFVLCELQEHPLRLERVVGVSRQSGGRERPTSPTASRSLREPTLTRGITRRLPARKSRIRRTLASTWSSSASCTAAAACSPTRT